MDFEAANWDVENDATELERSLFQNNKKKIKGCRKRKSESEIKPQNTVVNKKKKPNDGKVPEELSGKKGETKTLAVSTANGNEPEMSRKERRNKKWQEKILRRRLMSEKGEAVSSNKSETSSKVKNSPVEIKAKNKNMQHEKNRDIQAELSGSRFEKRKLKWEKMQKLKRQRLELKKSEKVSDTQLDKHSRASDRQSEQRTGYQGLIGKNINQMNRKERKKMEWKQKLKEKNLSDKNVVDDKGSSDEVIAFDKSHENKSKQKNKTNSIGQNDNLRNAESNNKNKRKVDQDSKNNGGESVRTEVKQSESSTGKELTQLGRENAVSGMGSSKNKKKRKRVCKRNKFKGYVKPEPKVTKDSTESSETEMEETLSPDKSVRQKVKDNNLTMSEMSDVVKPMKKVKQKIHKDKQEIKVSDRAKVAKHNSGDQLSETKHTKKKALDQEKLKIMLSPDSRKKLDVESGAGESENFRREKTEKKPKTLLEKSKERLNAARFRYLNEQLYTTTGHEAFQMFKNDTVAFTVYHEGFQGQVEKWPTNPVDVIIEKLQAKPKNLVLADFGCGDAKLARSVPNKVHSFDLVALNDHVTVCDMSKVPLKDGTVDIGVFCLSLMGTNLSAYLQEANRVLKHNGTLMIAEVRSRFDNIRSFVQTVERMGFKQKQQDGSNKMFVMMEFKKTADIKDKSAGDIQLKPCLYKKR